jgi:hypothetical protein
MMRVVAICWLALSLIVTLPFEVAAQSSCSGWNATCVTRCKEGGATSCPRCAEQLSECKKTGCWTEGKSFGGAKRCDLKKS